MRARICGLRVFNAITHNPVPSTSIIIWLFKKNNLIFIPLIDVLFASFPRMLDLVWVGIRRCSDACCTTRASCGIQNSKQSIKHPTIGMRIIARPMSSGDVTRIVAELGLAIIQCWRQQEWRIPQEACWE